MTKQLGMMYLLYYMRGQVIKIMNDFEHIREMFKGQQPEQIILSWLSTENNLICHLSAWEDNYKKDMEFRKNKTFNNDNDIITL